nr:nitrite reductase [NAD(P)H]-like [Tanacetum cinerariifolium]
LIVVGNGMVGHHCVEQLIAAGALERYRIHVFGEEGQRAYDRVHLSEYFGGRDAESLALSAASLYEHPGLTLHLGVPVLEIDRGRRELDDFGGAALKARIEALGVGVHLSRATQSISAGEEYRYRMNFAGEEFLETDLIVFSAGIRPQDALARQCELALGPRGGIAIDEHCRTSDADIFAIGECAAWNGSVFGLVAPGYQMARNVAAQLCDQDA